MSLFPHLARKYRSSRDNSTPTGRKSLLSILFILAVVLAGLGLPDKAGRAWQLEQTDWSQPVNLSQSGATADPQVIVDSNGDIHAIWLDKNAGFVYSHFGEAGWSAPALIAFPFNPENIEILLTSATFEPKPPRFLADQNGYIHAFWRGPQNDLLYSRVYARDIASESAWLNPRPIAESAEDHDVVIDAAGRMHIVYVRVINADGLPAGIYYRYSNDNGVNWAPGKALYVSRYLQGLESEEANVNIGALSRDDALELIVVWDNPRLRRVYSLRSIDRGASWGEVVEVAGPESDSLETPYNLDVFIKDTQVLFTWHSDLGGRVSCSHYYQTSADGGVSWNESRRMLERNLACPASFYFLGELGGNDILWTVLDGNVYLLAWDWQAWSEPQRQSEISQFTNAVTYQRVILGCEEGLLLPGNRLIAIGCDEENEGDIWAASRSIDNVDGWYSAAGFWSPPIIEVSDGLEILAPAVIADANKAVHLIWPQLVPSENLQPVDKEALYYAGLEGEAWAIAGEVINSPKGKVSQPSLALDENGKLYMVWSEGSYGDLYFSWASVSKAAAQAEWIDPVFLPSLRSVNRSPEVVVSATGNVFVAYAIPLNEDRGIYLTQSTDVGETWSEPVAIVDALALGWDMVDQPHLAISQNGELHIIWTRTSLSSAAQNSGLYYSHSVDQGETWSEPQPVTDKSIGWSKLMRSGNSLHRLWLETLRDASILWHEVSTDDGVSWRRFSVLSGFGEQEANFSLVSDGLGGIHLVQIVESGESRWYLRYFLWDGERWSIQDETDLLIDVNAEIISAAAVYLPDNHLGVFYELNRTGVVEGKNILNFITRALNLPDVLKIPLVVESTPVATLSARPTQTPTSIPVMGTATSTVEAEGTPNALATIAQLQVETIKTATAQAMAAKSSLLAGQAGLIVILVGGVGIVLLGLIVIMLARRRGAARRN